MSFACSILNTASMARCVSVAVMATDSASQPGRCKALPRLGTSMTLL